MGTDTEGVQPTHSFPGENEIGSMLAEICAKIGHHSKWELREWVAGAKLLVIMRDVYGYTGERYEQYAVARMPIRTRAMRTAYTCWATAETTTGLPMVIWSCRDAKPSHGCEATTCGRIGAR